ncbi:M15 family peptidase [bacterium]|nr:M15 family peptidase [bacterium]
MFLSFHNRVKLAFVHPELVRVFDEAVNFYSKKIRIIEGLRSVQRQNQLYLQGKTKTLDSRHLTGHALDLVTQDNGNILWDEPNAIQLAAAIRASAIKCGVPIRWGGCWQEINTVVNLKQAATDYVARLKAQKRKPLIDMVHFELPKDRYPS